MRSLTKASILLVIGDSGEKMSDSKFSKSQARRADTRRYLNSVSLKIIIKLFKFKDFRNNCYLAVLKSR